jgi:hypothetical protein
MSSPLDWLKSLNQRRLAARQRVKARRLGLAGLTRIDIVVDADRAGMAARLQSVLLQAGLQSALRSEPTDATAHSICIVVDAHLRADRPRRHIAWTLADDAADLAQVEALAGAHSVLDPSLARIERLAALGMPLGKAYHLPPASAATGTGCGDALLDALTRAAHCVKGPGAFTFHVARYLLANDVIDFEVFYSLAASQVALGDTIVCLGLPEYTQRLRSFAADNGHGIAYFPGLRHTLGWIGCGMSYKFLARKALDAGLTRITICEDDVEFRPGWSERYCAVKAHLDTRGDDWDLFAGMITDLHPEVHITAVGQFGASRLLQLDRMTAMVFNIYSLRGLAKLAQWDHSDFDSKTNAIDRHLERQAGLSVLTAIPYLVGHKDDLHSTLWKGQANAIYDERISRSEAALAAAARADSV